MFGAGSADTGVRWSQAQVEWVDRLPRLETIEAAGPFPQCMPTGDAMLARIQSDDEQPQHRLGAQTTVGAEEDVDVVCVEEDARRGGGGGGSEEVLVEAGAGREESERVSVGVGEGVQENQNRTAAKRQSYELDYSRFDLLSEGEESAVSDASECS